MPRQSSREPSQRRDQRRRTHRYTDSNTELVSPARQRHADSRSPSPSPRKSRPKKPRTRDHYQSESEASKSTRNALSAGVLAQLDAVNKDLGWDKYDGVRTGDRERNVIEDEEELARREKRRERRVRGGLDEEEEELLRRKERHERRERRRKERHGGADGPGREREPRKRGESHARTEGRSRQEGQTRQESHARKESHTRKESRTRREKVRAPVGYSKPEEPEIRRRIISGTHLEQGTQLYSEKEATYEYEQQLKLRGGAASEESDEEYEARRKRRKRWIILGVAAIVILVAIAIALGVVFAGKSSSSKSSAAGASNSTTASSKPSNSNLNGISESDIPTAAQGTVLDPFIWYDTTDFNVTYTDETVGGLSVMGLNSTWDDSKKANDKVPALDSAWQYGTMPVRGVNIGGWLSIEPWITPSMFDSWTTHDNVIDEYTLSSTLGPSKAASTLEQHYSSFVTEQTFQDIQAAGLDHVRIPFSYWAVTTYDGDPYVPQISWRYLLRGIEWARKCGLRVNLDLHGAPGSQNGWNHSGRQGPIGWLNGTDGALNGQRALDVHDQLSKFFAQPRYKNIVTMYGLVNEPKMTYLEESTVLNWTSSAIDLIRNNNVTAVIIFGDGFMGLDNWQGKLQNYDNLLLDVHQYVIFNTDQIALNHSDKVNFACGGWTAQTLRSQDTSTGFGPTLCGEWSQADTDCAQYLNNVGVGSRWEGTLNMVSTPGGSSDGSVLSPTCPTQNSPRCSCTEANADPSTYSDEYKQWLLDFAEAQMTSFEKGWGWFYWTWQTETASQWSYKAGIAAGIMPKLAYERTFSCSSVPDYASQGLAEYY